MTAADQTPTTERCCKHPKCPGDSLCCCQTPTTDSERDERAVALCSADDTREHHDQTDDHPCTRCRQTADSERVEQIRARVEAATKGPWESYTVPESKGEACYSAVEIGDHEVRLDWLYGSGLDANFIAQARDDIPYLLDLLAEQTSTIERVRKVRDKHWGTLNSLLANEINTALGSQRTEGQRCLPPSAA